MRSSPSRSPTCAPSRCPVVLVVTVGRVRVMEDTGLGELLRRHRRGAGLTQEELAERAGVSARTVSDVERGLRDRVYRDTAARIAVALGMGAADRAVFEAAARGRGPGPGSDLQWR